MSDGDDASACLIIRGPGDDGSAGAELMQIGAAGMLSNHDADVYNANLDACNANCSGRDIHGADPWGRDIQSLCLGNCTQHIVHMSTMCKAFGITTTPYVVMFMKAYAIQVCFGTTPSQEDGLRATFVGKLWRLLTTFGIMLLAYQLVTGLANFAALFAHFRHGAPSGLSVWESFQIFLVLSANSSYAETGLQLLANGVLLKWAKNESAAAMNRQLRPAVPRTDLEETAEFGLRLKRQIGLVLLMRTVFIPGLPHILFGAILYAPIYVAVLCTCIAFTGACTLRIG
eukprot:SAG22_NODE_3345_length_1765_cov_1.587635_2_plen_286_part_00